MLNKILISLIVFSGFCYQFSYADDLQGLQIELRRELAIPLFKENVAIQDGLVMSTFREIDLSRVHCEVLKPGSSLHGYTFPRGTKWVLSNETQAFMNGNLVIGSRYISIDSDVEISIYPAGFNLEAVDILKEHPEVLSVSAFETCLKGLADVTE